MSWANIEIFVFVFKFYITAIWFYVTINRRKLSRILIGRSNVLFEIVVIAHYTEFVRKKHDNHSNLLPISSSELSELDIESELESDVESDDELDDEPDDDDDSVKPDGEGLDRSGSKN